MCGVTQIENVSKIETHTYDDNTDAECNFCGFIREITIDTLPNVPETDEPVVEDAIKGDKPATEDGTLDSTEDTTKNDTEKNSAFGIFGCGSIVSANASFVLLLTISGAGALLKKKED